MVKKDEAKEILKIIGMPKTQQSDLCAYTLLSLLGLKEEMKWSESKNEYFRIHDIIVFIKDNYNIAYAENSRETFRKQALHHFRMSALIEDNGMSTNSPNYRYRITEEALNLIRTYNSIKWKSKINSYLEKHSTLISIYENKRKMSKMPINVEGNILHFSTGNHNQLQKAIIEEFASRFAKDSKVLYVGDTLNKYLYRDDEILNKICVDLGEHEKLPDVLLYDEKKDWLFFIEAVTSVGPIDPKRIIEIENMTQRCKSKKIYITAFQDMKTFKKFAETLAWETEVWLEEMPDHMIHLNGDRFLAPHN